MVEVLPHAVFCGNFFSTDPENTIGAWFVANFFGRLVMGRHRNRKVRQVEHWMTEHVYANFGHVA